MYRISILLAMLPEIFISSSLILGVIQDKKWCFYEHSVLVDSTKQDN